VTSPPPMNLAELRDELRAFAAERDWDQFHTPKNLASALSVEAAELLEPFQWLKTGELHELDHRKQEAIRHELADVLIYLVRLADKLDVDLIDAALEKLAHNRDKYPVNKVRSDSRKYSEY
jgi:NTP pyrophosphatase (non-canonical NTP hydrolase)